jgi:conjugal transfer pilus assembly protein TraV
MRATHLQGLALGSAALLLGGCATSFNGLGGEPRYACQAPTGAQCTSVSGIYANTNPSAPSKGKATHSPATLAASAQKGAWQKSPGESIAAPVSSMTTRQVTPARQTSETQTLRTPPRLLRLWVAPWEDSDGDLHEAATVHLVADTGRWQIDRVRPVTQGPARVLPPTRLAPSEPTAATPATQATHGFTAPMQPRSSNDLTPDMDPDVTPDLER